ncbi:MAG: hypothetical protein BWY66_02000 [bacterium ADurb.Bin374]|nr:MAG: hypothetical protein BWY66_02000 [bacterium ADurb.Bin374]
MHISLSRAFWSATVKVMPPRVRFWRGSGSMIEAAAQPLQCPHQDGAVGL